ncbi:MAG: hypothetical protein KDA65_19820, partial [Planctomycetaceae bacterium]|nr:hypothetical protein [Planctomycetaceae bacterium]
MAGEQAWGAWFHDILGDARSATPAPWPESVCPSAGVALILSPQAAVGNHWAALIVGGAKSMQH